MVDISTNVFLLIAGSIVLLHALQEAHRANIHLQMDVVQPISIKFIHLLGYLDLSVDHYIVCPFWVSSLQNIFLVAVSIWLLLTDKLN